MLEFQPKKDEKLPEPISMAVNPELRETLEVFVIGFPFGKLLGGRKGNPAPTVGRGFVSSLRRNNDNEIIAVQIDGALNPGNSGGPILDREGRLLGNRNGHRSRGFDWTGRSDTALESDFDGPVGELYNSRA